MFILIVPIGVFFLTNPYALLDLPTFLKHTGWEIYHYSVKGHPDATCNPGWEHFLLQISRIKKTISPFLFFLALGGILVSLKKFKLSFITLVFPVIYLLYMTQQKVTFHRNYVVLYPFFAIYSALMVKFIASLFSRTGQIMQRTHPLRMKYVNKGLFLIPFCGVVIFLSGSYIDKFEQSISIWKSTESRSRAIDYINTLVDQAGNKTCLKIGIARELNVHPLDLKRLKTEYHLFPHNDIKSALQECDYLLVGEYGSFTKSWHDDDKYLNKLTPRNYLCHTIKGNNARRDTLSINPEVLVLKCP